MAHPTSPEFAVRWHRACSLAGVKEANLCSTYTDVFLSIRGELDITTVPAFREARGEALAAAIRDGLPLTLSLHELTFTDSTGIGALIHTAQLAHRAHIGFATINVPAAIAETLRICGLNSYLNIT